MDQEQHDEALILDLVKTLLGSLEIGGSQGRQQFLSTLAPFGTACHSRAGMFPPGLTEEQASQPPYNVPKLQYEAFARDFASRIPWDACAAGDMQEGIDGQPTVMIDHDLATVWCPYWFLSKGKLSHVGTNCFALLRGSWGEVHPGSGDNGRQEWKIVGMTDTGRLPSEDDRRRLAHLSKPSD